MKKEPSSHVKSDLYMTITGDQALHKLRYFLVQ